MIYLGRTALELAADDLNLLLARFAGPNVAFEHGCFRLYQKLPLGLGLSFLAVPQSAPGWLVLSIPFDHIRGDRTGGLASMLAGGLWGPLLGEIEKRARKALVSQGLPVETIRVENDPSKKAGRVVLDLQSVNAWLMARPPVQGLKCTLESCHFSEYGAQLALDVFQA